MKIVIPGGSGQVGTILARSFVADGHEVVVLSRQPRQAPWRVVVWDGESLGDWSTELEGADVVINLAGRSVNCRYNERNRRLIKQSRVKSTQVVGQAIENAVRPPRVWLQMSTATIYAHRYDTANDEASGIIGGTEADVPDTWRFSIDVASSWEGAAGGFDLPDTRLVIMRMAVNMSPTDNGPFDILAGLVRKRLGGAQGDGRQFVSWIHDHDMVRAVNWLIDHEEFKGAVNVSSPNPVPNAEFMKTLRNVCGVSFGLPIKPWMLAIGAVFMKTETELVLKSRRVTPGRLANSGFVFDYPKWRDAALELNNRWCQQRNSSDAQRPHGDR